MAEEQATTEQAQETGGLLDDATVEAETPDPHSEPKATTAHLASDDPATRPDWLPEKFWGKDDKPNWQGLAKSYGELEKQFRSGAHKPPADGNYSTEVLKGVPAEDPALQAFVGWAKETGISQASFDALAGKIIQLAGERQAQAATTIKEQREALGPNADAVIKDAVSWASTLVRKGIWNQDDFNEFKIWGGTANGIRALNKLRGALEGRVPIAPVPVENAPSQEELLAMVGDPRYQTDAAYRQKIEKQFERVFGNAPATSSAFHG